MKRSDQINELAAALAKAQAKIRVAPKDSRARVPLKDGKSYEYSYSTLADVLEACRAPLAENGIAVLQPVVSEGPAVHITTLLAHSSGQWVEETLTMIAGDARPQSIGSCITYGRRYALGSMVGVVSEEDDDGAEATRPTHNGNGHSRPAAPPPQRAAPQVDPASSALVEEFAQGISQAKDDATIKHIIASVAADHKAHRLNDLQAKALKDAIIARRLELGIVSQAAAS